VESLIGELIRWAREARNFSSRIPRRRSRAVGKPQRRVVARVGIESFGSVPERVGDDPPAAINLARRSLTGSKRFPVLQLSPALLLDD
jgi:hypothetical protein